MWVLKPFNESANHIFLINEMYLLLFQLLDTILHPPGKKETKGKKKVGFEITCTQSSLIL